MITTIDETKTTREVTDPDSSEAYEQVVEAYYTPTYRYARGLAYNEADAQDLTQHAFLKLKTHFDKIRDLNRVKGWLFTTVRHEFIKGFRHQSKFPKVPLEATAPRMDPAARPGETGIDAQKALAGLHQLPEKFRSPLALFYLEQWAYKDIAEHLNLPIGTVMSRLSRGKSQLRAWLETTLEREICA